MKQKQFEKLTKEAAKLYASKKNVASKPETQFQKGAQWAWEILAQGHTRSEYEEMLRQDVCDRYGIHEPERWMNSLIAETAEMMTDRDGMQADIIREGRLVTKIDKNMNEYKESNPLYVHLKELQRSIGMQREHLGLSAKSIKKPADPKKGVDAEKSGLTSIIATAQREADVPDID